MKPVINLALRTEYSFKKTFGFAKSLADIPVHGCVGVADINNTYAHYEVEKHCIEKDVKPIFGVRLSVWPNLEKSREYIGPEYIFLAKNQFGLEEIYAMVFEAYENFYYAPRIDFDSVRNLSENVIVMADNFFDTERLDYIALTPRTPILIAKQEGIPKVYISNNYFPRPQDREVYELMAGSRKDGNGYQFQFETQIYPQHILSSEEHFLIWGDEDAVENSYVIADSIEDFKIQKAPMVKYHGELQMKTMCVEGATEKGIDLFDEKYAERLDYELDLIEEKGYVDYFMIVGDMIKKAKKRMLVGPARGSSAGSLVCYLMDITAIDPIEYGLLFERFIDLNRLDLPDIDIDFPDKHRAAVIKQLVKDHGADKVRHIANVNRLKPRSAIGEFAKALDIPPYETEEIKDAIVERSGGDARAAMTMMDTFEHTEIGKKFIEKYPSMRLCERVENHASHTGMHAAGIIVCSEPLIKFGGINTRDDVMMVDKKAASQYNLLKIDCLGLRTLTVLQECAVLAGFDYNKYYDLPLTDENVFKMFDDLRLSGIFQFEGYALASVTREMGVEKFDDIVAITSLARPGPLHSGGTNTYIKRRIGEEKVKYISKHESYVRNTKESYGIIIFQEQLMNVAREMGNMSWADVSALRNAMSKTLGEEFFNKYKEKFMAGSKENGIAESEAEDVWGNMVTFGSWGFNKSHAVAYSMISYWTAWAKTYHPLEFAVANLNNARNEDSALKILRDLVKHDGIEYISFDPDASQVNWIVHDGKILGGLMTAKGIGITKARAIIKKRELSKRGEEPHYTPSEVKILFDPTTIFDILFPCDNYFGKYYSDPTNNGLAEAPAMIESVEEAGVYIVIGQLKVKNLRDLNELSSLVKRGGKVMDHDALFLNMTIEDDTDSIIAQIDRFSFEEKGREIAEAGRPDFDWYIIKGKIDSGWRLLKVIEIFCLTSDWKVGEDNYGR